MTGSAGQQRVPSLVLEEFELPLPATIKEQQRIATVLNKADRLRRTRRYAQQLSDTFLQSVFVEMFGDASTNPKRWQTKPLEELLSIAPHIGTTVPAGEVGKQLCVRVGEVGLSSIALERCKYVSLKGSELKRFTLLPGDLVLARAIGSESHLGKLSVMGKCSIPVVFDSHIMRLRPNASTLTTSYLSHMLRTEGGRRKFMRQARRTAVQFNINAEQISALEIPLPPLTLQQEFAIIVQRFERLSAQQREAARQAEHLFQTLLHRAFRGEL